MTRATGLPPSMLKAWIEASEAAEPLSPLEELRIEHRITETVLEAMEVEGRRLRAGEPLRTGFWAGVVDFLGNFAHRCHRTKKERLVPALQAWGALPPGSAAVLEEEHREGRDLILELCNGFNDGDWEKVMRVVSLYLHFMRGHMAREETEILEVAGGAITEARSHALREDFDFIEREALGDRPRAEIVELARRLRAEVGLDAGLLAAEG